MLENMEKTEKIKSIFYTAGKIGESPLLFRRFCAMTGERKEGGAFAQAECMVKAAFRAVFVGRRRADFSGNGAFSYCRSDRIGE